MSATVVGLLNAAVVLEKNVGKVDPPFVYVDNDHNGDSNNFSNEFCPQPKTTARLFGTTQNDDKEEEDDEDEHLLWNECFSSSPTIQWNERTSSSTSTSSSPRYESSSSFCLTASSSSSDLRNGESEVECNFATSSFAGETLKRNSKFAPPLPLPLPHPLHRDNDEGGDVARTATFKNSAPTVATSLTTTGTRANSIPIMTGKRKHRSTSTNSVILARDPYSQPFKMQCPRVDLVFPESQVINGVINNPRMEEATRVSFARMSERHRAHLEQFFAAMLDVKPGRVKKTVRNFWNVEAKAFRQLWCCDAVCQLVLDAEAQVFTVSITPTN